MIKLANRVSNLSVAATIAMKRKANELAAKGVDVVDFGIGEPDFPTPEFIKMAADRAMAKNYTKYTNTGGIPELRNAVADKYHREYGANFDAKREVVITCGGKQALYNVMFALFDRGDEVILPNPYWVTFPEQIKLSGASMVELHTCEENGFSLSAGDVEKLITPRTKGIILNFPNNPTGAVIPKRELQKIIEMARKRDFYVIFDECYEKFVYNGSSISGAPFGKENVILVGSCSKTYSMTGWRIGWAAGPAEVIQAMENLQSQSTSNPNSIAQWAAVEALTCNQSFVQAMIDEYRRRRDVVVDGLNRVPGIKCALPEGAFYAFPNVSGCFNSSIRDSNEFINYLLEEAGVVTISGLEFGRDGYLRLSYATSMERINEGLKRVQKLFG
ncbi:pyridoxal phosphate-dependent aminotransferase [Candidatus Acetothermia bacterium]|nr:pyridoxal phosphate-dependent aminotransferase [Candidatus Acetothermia bacterium]MBI3642543.1 pyridoxal phosphate-dependent aminotransferase [Candidatus Acetothermia bacterium]